jgi:hypothetical protein
MKEPGFALEEKDLREIVDTLAYYATTYCEGWCAEAGGNFEDCGGCRARIALETAQAAEGCGSPELSENQALGCGSLK